MTLEIKQYDDSEGVHGILKRKGKEADLTDAYVTFHIRAKDGSVAEGVATVLDPLAGEVYYPLQGSSVEKVGFLKLSLKLRRMASLEHFQVEDS